MCQRYGYDTIWKIGTTNEATFNVASLGDSITVSPTCIYNLIILMHLISQITSDPPFRLSMRKQTGLFSDVPSVNDLTSDKDTNT